MFEAFELLSTCRQVSQGGVGPIPWSAIDQFAQQQGFADDEVACEDFVHIMQALDEVYLTRKAAEVERERKKASTHGNAQAIHAKPVRARPRR